MLLVLPIVQKSNENNFILDPMFWMTAIIYTQVVGAATFWYKSSTIFK